MTKELGMTFRGDMVRALIDGTKTQTRRPMDPQPKGFPGWWPHEEITPTGKWVGNTWHWASEEHFRRGAPDVEPLKVGDRVYVQEELRGDGQPGNKRVGIMRYGLDGEMVLPCSTCGWVFCTEGADCGAVVDTTWEYDTPTIRPSEMPLWASRITLEVTEIRAQRIQDISEKDAISESVVVPRCGFAAFWNSFYPGSWERNDWVWAYSFKVLEVKGRAA